MTRMWLPKGKTPEILCPATFDKIGINGTINMTTGQVYSEISSEFNADGFLNYLKTLAPNIPEGKKFLVILDNARPHHAKKVTAYIEENCPHLELFILLIQRI